MKLKGFITQLKARINASGDAVQTVSLEVHGDFSALHALLKKPLDITLQEEEIGPFESAPFKS